MSYDSRISAAFDKACHLPLNKKSKGRPWPPGDGAESRQRLSEASLPSRCVSPLLQKLKPGVGSLAGQG